MTKVKEYVFEITTTKEVKVRIPEAFLNQEIIDEWESELGTLEGNTSEGKVQYIARHAAEMEAKGFDGIGVLYSQYNKFDREADKRIILVQEIYEDIEAHLVKKGEWEDE